MALDREDTLKKAEKLLRQGRLDAAIAEYVRVVEDQPRDWNTANMLGDLYVRAGQSDRAVAQYGRIADHFFGEGFYPKAAALFKKILKITPDDETTQLKLAELSTKQGLLADAKAYLTAVGSRRRARGDERGANEIVVKLGSLDPSDIDARMAAARVLSEGGEKEVAAARFREVYDDLVQKGGRDAEALVALTEAVRLNPADRQGRGVLARALVASGDVARAREYLDRETAAGDADLLVALAEIELGAGNLDQARAVLSELLALAPDSRQRIVELGWSLSESNADAAFACIEVGVDASIAAREFDDAAAILQEFITRRPGQIPALLKLVEVCVDGGLESIMYETQAELADSYLGSGHAAEARVIAEDLVAREPWERAHIERFRKALVMLKVPEPDSVIAERLSGQTPFTATDPFSDEPASAVAPAGAATASAAPAPSDIPEPPVPIPAPAEPQQAAVAPSLAPTVPVPPPPAPTPAVAPPVMEAHRPVTPAPDEPAIRRSAPAPAPGKRGPMEIDLTQVLGEIEGLFTPPVAAAPQAAAPQTPPSAPPPPAVPSPAPSSSHATLDDVFKDFHDAVNRQSGVDQSAQHMKLAHTYLEMGMLEEAITALKNAVRSPKQRFEAGVLLGRLYKSRGDVPHAIEWFERAAEAPAPTVDEGRALLYNLAATLEESGEVARALAVFLELQADAGDYRDVAARVEHLSRVQTGG